MPLQAWSKRLFGERIDFEHSLTNDEIGELIADSKLKVLQFSNPVNIKTWELLNNEFFTIRPEIQLRAYGFYSSTCDLSFTSIMTNVRHFSADCLMNAQGVEHIGSMENLETLGVGIFHLTGFEFLNQVTQQLKNLYLGRTKSNKPSLKHIARFEALEEINIEGQNKDIEVLSSLKNLRRVVLRSISTPDLSYLKSLRRMWSLEIKLGGIKDLNAIEKMENIKYLELWQITGLSDINVISSLTGLQYLFLQSLRNITSLPSFSRLDKLRRIYLENLKGLKNIATLEYAPVLEEFIHWNAQNMQPEDYIPLFRNPSLKRVAVGLGSDKKNKRFNELQNEFNIETAHVWREFEFV